MNSKKLPWVERKNLDYKAHTQAKSVDPNKLAVQISRDSARNSSKQDSAKRGEPVTKTQVPVPIQAVRNQQHARNLVAYIDNLTPLQRDEAITDLSEFVHQNAKSSSYAIRERIRLAEALIDRIQELKRFDLQGSTLDDLLG